YCATAISHARKLLRLPESPGCTVNTAISAGSRNIRHSSSQTSDIFTTVTSTVLIDIRADTVQQTSLRDHHATVKQVNDLFLAAVLQHFQTGHSDSIGI